MSETEIKLFEDFMGLGYIYDARPTALLVFDKRKAIGDVWKKIIKWWPDDEIMLRFVENDDSYEFVLYGQSRILETNWMFLKRLKTSENYKRFKDDYDGAAYLGLALYIRKDNSYELEVFRQKKRITNVKFLTESEAADDSTVLMSRQINRTEKNLD
ncbi:MAG: hypothetical protein HY295_05825 [Thaumarchaeota archaeon]|nr:hypothetical protein [Nitrososphaerota archaeon]